MKKYTMRFKLLCIVCVCFFHSCKNKTQYDLRDTGKILIVYYSQQDNTDKMAKLIQEITGGELFEIVSRDIYPDDDYIKYDQVMVEIEYGYLPILNERKENIHAYDILFIGSPNWWGSIAPPVNSFLHDHDLGNKTIIPFSTTNDKITKDCLHHISTVCPTSKILKGLSLHNEEIDDSKDVIAKWINSFQD